MAKITKQRGFVYFMLNPSTGLIKIGHTGRPERRIMSLSLTGGVRLDLLGVIAGDRDLEGSLHHLFKDKQVLGEWFADSPAIRAYIAANALPKEVLAEQRLAQEGIEQRLAQEGNEQRLAQQGNEWREIRRQQLIEEYSRAYTEDQPRDWVRRKLDRWLEAREKS